MSFVSEQESFSTDSLAITSLLRSHFLSTSSYSCRYFLHAPGLQWHPVRMWMFCFADAVWIS